MLPTGKKVSVGRVARKPTLRIIVLCVAVSALSQVLFTLACSVFEMRLWIDFLPEIAIAACFLISYTTGFVSNLRSAITTKSAIDKVASDGKHRARPAASTDKGAPPKEPCHGSSKDSGEQAANSWPWPSGMRAIDRAQIEGVFPEVPSCSEVMHACIRRQQVDTALRLFDQMLEEGVGNDARHIGKATSDKFFNLVAYNLDEKRLRKDGLSLFQVVEAHGIAPSTAIQNRVIVAWRSRPPKSVVKYLLGIKNSGYVVSRLACFSIMLFCERSDPEVTLKLRDELESSGILLDKVAYNAVMGACRQLGRYDEAGLLFAQMADRGLTPDLKTYCILIHVNTRNNNFRQAVALLETMREQGLQPNRHAYHDAILSCISLQRVEHAVELYNDMIRAEVAPRARTADYLRTACDASGLSFSAVECATRCKDAVADERSG